MWNISGYDHIISYFENAVKADRLGHSYLFLGPTGVGKSTLAINLAQLMNCRGPNPPCGSCSQCSRIFKGIHSDVRILSVDREADQRMIGLAAIREIQQESYLEPFEGDFRVYIVDGAEYLTDEASNRFLKLLEEPPPHVIFILLSTDSSLLLSTIVSRCHQIDFRPLPTNMVSTILRNQFGASEPESSMLAWLAEGRLGWAIRAKTEPGILEELSHVADKFLFLATAPIPERLEFAEELASLFPKDPRKVQQILTQWIFWWRVLLLVRFDRNEFTQCPEAFMGIETVAKDYKPTESVQSIKAIQETSKLLDSNVNPRLALESLVLALPKLY